MKKIYLILLGVFTGLLLTGTGCEQLSKPSEPIQPVTHITFRGINPDNQATGDTFDVYLSDIGSRAEISETIHVDGLEPDTTTTYTFSDLATKQEYMFTYPNTLTEADLAVMPNDHPLKAGDNIIMQLSMADRPSGKPEISLIEFMIQPLLNIPEEQINSNATKPYVIVDEYIDEFDENSPLEQRLTINPVTNLPTQVEIIDRDGNTPIETFAVDTYEISDTTEYPDDFFTLDGWKQSLPGENHIVVKDDIWE